MPGYKGHLVGGLIVGGLGLYVVQSLQPTYMAMAEWVLCALAGALFPDIDIKSKGQKVFYRFLLVLFGFLLIKGHIQIFILMSVLAVVPMIVRHRGLFHKLWFVVGFPTIVALCITAYFPDYRSILFYDVSFFIAGAVSHLWLDVGLRRMFRF
ncbi:MAG: metal-dependent hydrolase [Candidatus Dependentiae bacterium]|nr:metal-dependent hydrolase [Candidatus Dependentiae bacterium]